ncbi:14929_t:CDS:2 [Dentiscutata erythropus]|uniref:14929_t:CDS:1 n=1 Tax=Dentiscutata erythropus TaxID=1348616 RepID=A0A9N9E834_9GLOM|nr:14929_t:CDS:2 [Dentiscutata erythropus]
MVSNNYHYSKDTYRKYRIYKNAIYYSYFESYDNKLGFNEEPLINILARYFWN